MQPVNELTQRPLVPADARAVYEVMAAQEKADVGDIVIEEADIVGDWQRPSFDVSDSTTGFFDGDRLVGYGEVSGSWHGDSAVHPDYRGRGIGTQIAQWMQGKARERGSDIVGMPVPQGSPGDRLLESLGYFVRWTSWVLELPPVPTSRSATTTGRIRRTRGDPRGVRRLLDRHRGHVPRVVGAGARHVRGLGGQRHKAARLRAVNLRVAVDAEGAVVGTAVVHKTTTTGTSTSWPPARTTAARDSPSACSSMPSDGLGCTAAPAPSCPPTRTGALALYEKVGMEPTSIWLHRAIKLAD